MKLCSTLSLSAAIASTLLATDTKIKVGDLPAAVTTAMKDQIRGTTVLGASKEREHGHTTYEVQTRLDGKSRDLTFSQDGSLLKIEQEIALDTIPEPARAAIHKRAAGGLIERVELVSKDSITSYKADVKSPAGKMQEVAVNADGSPYKEK